MGVVVNFSRAIIFLAPLTFNIFLRLCRYKTKYSYLQRSQNQSTFDLSKAAVGTRWTTQSTWYHFKQIDHNCCLDLVLLISCTLIFTRVNLACCVRGNVQYRAQFQVLLPESEGKIALYCIISYTFPLKETWVFFQWSFLCISPFCLHASSTKRKVESFPACIVAMVLWWRNR